MSDVDVIERVFSNRVDHYNRALSRLHDHLKKEIPDIDDRMAAAEEKGRRQSREFINEFKSYELLDHDLGTSSGKTFDESRPDHLGDLADVIGPMKGLISPAWIEKRTSRVLGINNLIDEYMIRASRFNEKFDEIEKDSGALSSTSSLPRELLDVAAGVLKNTGSMLINDAVEVLLFIEKKLGELDELKIDSSNDDLPVGQIDDKAIESMLFGWSKARLADAVVHDLDVLKTIDEKIDSVLSDMDKNIEELEASIEDAKNEPSTAYLLPVAVIEMCTGSAPDNDKKSEIERLNTRLRGLRKDRSYIAEQMRNSARDVIDYMIVDSVAIQIAVEPHNRRSLSEGDIKDACARVIEKLNDDRQAIIDRNIKQTYSDLTGRMYVTRQSTQELFDELFDDTRKRIARYSDGEHGPFGTLDDR